MSKFLQNLKSLCILFDKEATFTTAVNQFKLVKSGLETLDAAIQNCDSMWSSSTQLGFFIFDKIEISCNRFLHMLVSYDTFSLKNIIKMSFSDIDKLGQSFSECEAGKKEYEITKKLNEYKLKWPQFDMKVSNEDEFFKRLSLDSLGKLSKIWLNLRQKSIHNLTGFLCELDTSNKWNDTEEVKKAIFASIQSSVGVFFINKTARYKQQALSGQLTSGTTQPFSKTVVETDLNFSGLKMTPYICCAIASYNDIYANILIDGGLNFDKNNPFALLDNEKNNEIIDKLLTISTLNSIENLPGDICTTIAKFLNTTDEIFLMYDPTFEFLNIEKGILYENLPDDTCYSFVVPVKRSEGTFLQVLADLAVTYKFDPFVGVLTKPQNDSYITWLITLLVFLLIIMVLFVLWAFNETKKPRKLKTVIKKNENKEN